MRHRGQAFLSAALLSVASFVGCDRARVTTETSEAPPIVAQAEAHVPEPAEALPKPDTYILVSASQAYPGYEGVENGFPISVAIDDGQIVFRSSTATGFALPGGEIVGVTRFQDLNESQRRHIQHEPGFAYTCDSADGWKVAWDWNEPPSAEDPILWAFKRTPRPEAVEDLSPSGGWVKELDHD